MSSDPNNPIYVNHSIRPNRPPTMERKEIDAKEFIASAIVDSVVSNYEDYWTSDLHNRKTYSQPTNINYRHDYITRSEQTTPKQPIKSHIHLSNDHHHKLYITPNNHYYTHSQLSLPKPTRPIHPPLLSPMDYVIHSKHDIDKQRFIDDHEQYNDTIGYHHIEPSSIQYQSYHPHTIHPEERILSVNDNITGNLNRRYPYEYEQYYYSPDTTRRIQTMRNSDYPSRFRERIHTYQPTHTAATTLLYSNEYNQNGTLKASKPKIKAEQYKCSEVYNWPPKFPKLKRRKTNPPKQIHTGQDHIMIKQQLRTSTPIIQQKESNIEPIHCIKVNNQYQPSNYKTDVNASPERQITSLHSLQRSTLLEKSNRTSGTESRDQLFIADYKQMPGNQVGESIKVNTLLLTLPYYTKMINNKQFNKFHYNNHNHNKLNEMNNNNNNNNNNNIVMSSEVLQCNTLKSSEVLIHALNTIYSLLQLNTTTTTTNTTNISSSNNNEYKKLLINCLSEYLFSCMKLNSLDLHGDYATFVFPLKYFNEQLWYKYGYIDNWNDIMIIGEPNTNYEYVLLNEFSTTIKFPTKTIDKLLTNWLDNQTTKTPLTHHSLTLNTKRMNSKEKTTNEKLLHSISIATTLKLLLDSYEKSNEKDKEHKGQNEADEEDKEHEGQNEANLFIICIKLSVLLSLSECLNNKCKASELNLTPENILLILSSTNCLIIFKNSMHTTNNVEYNDNETILKDHDKMNIEQLLNDLHIEHNCNTLNNAINDLLKQLNDVIQQKIYTPEIMTTLLKSITPPDWITMCVARICLYNQTTE